MPKSSLFKLLSTGLLGMSVLLLAGLACALPIAAAPPKEAIPEPTIVLETLHRQLPSLPRLY